MRIIWDLGAVLLRWRPALLLRQVLPQRVHDDAAAARWAQRFFVEGGDWARFDRGELDEAALARRLAERTGLAPAEVHAVVQGVFEELQPLPDSVALLRRLHALGLRQHYFSNMPLPYAEHIEQRLPGFLDPFDGGLFSGRVKRMKPERGFFELAHERFGLAGQPALFIDDSPANVEAARAFGWQAVLFRDAGQVERELLAAGVALG